ncbi:MAG: CapA family protein [Nanoarchaeota archaeon]
MRLLIFGDISTWNISDFTNEKIDAKILSNIKKFDLVIYNLEGPIKKSNKKYNLQIRKNAILNYFYKSLLRIFNKVQPIVYSDNTILSLLKLNENVLVTLANNHIKDLGYDGFKDTINFLEKNKINYIGAGFNNYESSSDFIFDKYVIINCNFVGSKKLGVKFKIYNSTKTDYGSSYQNFNFLKNKISEYKKDNKKVILIIHGGKEMPEDELGINLYEVQKLGADYSIVHHFHKYIKTKYEKKNIFCIGDFIFNRPDKLPLDRKSGYVKISDGVVKCHNFSVGDVYGY